MSLIVHSNCWFNTLNFKNIRLFSLVAGSCFLVLFGALKSFAQLSASTKPTHTTLISKETHLQIGTANIIGNVQDEHMPALIENLSLEQRVGQLFILGFQGKSLNAQLISKSKFVAPGAYIFFKRNIGSKEKLQQLTSSLKKYSKISPFLMVDQEGGSVSRIQNDSPPLSALSMGDANTPAIAHRTGELTGAILTEVGFNFNLAPVADVSNPYAYNFIGHRSFGGTPHKVAKFAQNFADGLASQKVMPTFKHFPGHGGVKADSHKVTPKNLKSKDQLFASELAPFKALSQTPYPAAMMTAHISYPHLDASGTPATFSAPILQNILRKQFQFKGLVISDDLEMYGADVDSDIGERAIKALLAGVDMVMIAWSHRAQIHAYNKVLRAVRSGRIPEKLLDEKVARIMGAKKYYNISIKDTGRSLASHIQQPLRQLATLTNVHLLNTAKSQFANNSNIQKLIARSKKAFVFSATSLFYRHLQLQGIQKHFVRLRPKAPLKNINLNSAPNAFGVFYVSGKGSARLLNKMDRRLKNKIIVVNGLYPGAIKHPHLFAGIIHLNTRLDSVSKVFEKNLKTSHQLADDSIQSFRYRSRSHKNTKKAPL